MRMDEVKEWAADVMQKTFDGKKWKFAHTADNIAEKAYAEGVDAGFDVAYSIMDASYNTLQKVFPDIPFAEVDDINFYVLSQFKRGRDALKAWDAYWKVEADKCFPDAVKDEGLWLLYYEPSFDNVPRPYFMGTREDCEIHEKSDFLKSTKTYIVKVEQEESK